MTEYEMSHPAETDDALIEIVEAVRRGDAVSRPELVRSTGLGRSIVTQRVDQAIAMGLLEDAEMGPSTGGRAPRTLRFRSEQALFLVASLGALHIGIGVTDVEGRMLADEHLDWDISAGPEKTLERLASTFDALVAAHGDRPVWAVALGIPGPVEFRTARPVSPPIMPGWNRFDIRGWLSRRYGAPVWVDNDVNLMALGEWQRHRTDRAYADLLYVKVGSGVGAGIISNGSVHRGANGAAGDVGHISVTGGRDVPCRCGQSGCLEAIAGGWALVRDATEAAESSDGSPSSFIGDILASRALQPHDIAEGAVRGDPECARLVTRSGQDVGETIAALVNFFNPSLVIVGGTIAESGDLFIAAVRETVYRRSLPLATRELRIAPATTSRIEGLVGASMLALQQIFQMGMKSWISAGSPREVADELY